MAAVDLTIRGRVQGVGFRAFVQRTAITFGVSGEVWNAIDGTVRVHAEHDDEFHLAAFARMLQSGPGRIDAIDVEQLEGHGAVGFVIGAGR